MSNARAGLRAAVRPVTDAEAQQLRASTDTVVVAPKSAPALHLPADGTEPFCQSVAGAFGNDTEWRSKAIETYPAGYAPWCQYCGALFRNSEGES